MIILACFLIGFGLGVWVGALIILSAQETGEPR